MADYDNLTEGQLVETSAHINGWQKLRRLFMGSTRLSDIADGAQLTMAVGTYTGDGNATKAVTGVGFQPRFVIIYAQGSTNDGLAMKSSSDATTFAYLPYVSGGLVEGSMDDHIRSLDSDGFTVGDGTGTTNAMNINLRVYTYIAWR